eukprot:PRCOL_00002775-RA
MGNCFTCIETSNKGVITRCGKYDRIADAGCMFLNPCACENVAGLVSLKIQEVGVQAETKTKDNVFVTVRIAVQYVAMEDRVFDAFYKLQNPRSMMTSVVFDTVRSTLPKLTLDETFESKEELAHDTMTSLKSVMEKYGYLITNVMVTDVEPDSRVKQSMNEINAAKRMQDAAQYQADAMKIKVVKEAEADAESKYLAGTGIARQRKAIVDGLRQSIVSFSGEVADTTPREVIEMMLMTQYFDVLKDLGGKNGQGNTVFVNHSPGAVSDMGNEIRNSFMQAQAMKR